MSDNPAPKLAERLRPILECPKGELAAALSRAITGIEALECELAERTRERDESDALLERLQQADDAGPIMAALNECEEIIARHRASRPSASDRGKE